MRRVIVGAMVSIDGVMQAPGGPEEDPTGGFELGGWVAAALGDSDPVFADEIGKLFGQPFDLLLGRRTYDIFAAYWPDAEGGPHDGIARTFNRITKYVATRKGVDLTWRGSVALRDATRDVAEQPEVAPHTASRVQHGPAGQVLAMETRASPEVLEIVVPGLSKSQPLELEAPLGPPERPLEGLPLW